MCSTFKAPSLVKCCCFIFHCSDQISILLDRQEKLNQRQAELKALLEECEITGSTANDGVTVTAENWSGSFEWDPQAADVRFNVFGISTYRANQREVSSSKFICFLGGFLYFVYSFEKVVLRNMSLLPLSLIV